MSEYDPAHLFVSHTGTVHYAVDYQWGAGPECTERFLFGEPVHGVERSVTCQRCIVNHLPIVYEVRVPDRRTKIGYRVLDSTEDPDEVGDLLSRHGERAYVAETKPESVDA